MPSKQDVVYFCDMRDSIDQIAAFLVGFDFDHYAQDIRTRRAVERELQILTEAAFRLRDIADQLCPEIDWRSLRNFGNFLRHSYERVSDKIIWDTIHLDLPGLRTSVTRAIASLQAQQDKA